MPTLQASLRHALPTHPPGVPALGGAFWLVQWLIVAILAVSLPLQAVSAAVISMLGARHTHRAEVTERIVATDPHDSMGGWRDFRRAQYDDLHGHSRADAHEHAHALGLRHHHQLGDASVIQEDASDFADGGLSTDAAQGGASFLFMAAGNVAELPPPSEAFGKAWGTPKSAAPGTSDPRRIERPPQALST